MNKAEAKGSLSACMLEHALQQVAHQGRELIDENKRLRKTLDLNEPDGTEATRAERARLICQALNRAEEWRGRAA